MPNGIQAYGDYNQSTSGYRVLQPRPLDVYLGPWESIGTGNTAGTTSGGVSLANSIISGGVRYQGLQVIIIANSNPGQVGGQTLAYKYWYRGGTANENLVEFSAGGAGAGLDTSNTYTWTAHQNFSAGFSAAGGVTFTSLTHFTGGLSAAGATLGTLAVNGGISASGGITFNSLVQFTRGLSASGATLGTLVVNNGISASGATFANNVHVGGTLSVNGNFYVAGTLTTVNESQLLIQDKYLVLGSNLNTSSLADGAGIYIGSTTNAIAGICYSHGSTEWSSSHSFDIPSTSFYRVGGNDVLASTYLGSVVTGSSLASVGTITSGEWRGTAIGLTWGGFGASIATHKSAITALNSSGQPYALFGKSVGPIDEKVIVGNYIFGDNLSLVDVGTPSEWTDSWRGSRKVRKTSLKRYDQIQGLGTLASNNLNGSVFSPSQGPFGGEWRGLTLTIPLFSIQPDSSNYGKEDYILWDDYTSSSNAGVSAMSYNLQTGIVYFKQVEAIVDGGIF